MNPSDCTADPLDALAEEFAARYRRGERPSLTEYADRHPELAGRIRELFPAMVALERFGSVEGSPNGPVAGEPPLAGPLPSRLGDYLILREIGRGGMGVVFEAEQISLGRRVALKVLPRSVAGDARRVGRFLREARAAAMLHHTNIVPVFEVGREGEDSYYAMQFIHGQGLDQVIKELRRIRRRVASEEAVAPGPATPGDGRGTALPEITRSLLTGRFASVVVDEALPTCPETEALSLATAGLEAPSAASNVLPGGAPLSGSESGQRREFYRGVARVGEQAGAALSHAHSRGVIHRDIKPANLLLDTSGVVWVADFGLAKSGEDGLTNPGDVLGTLRYMAPERFRGGGDGRADIYALGLTLYELITLRPAFDAADRLALIESIKSQIPHRPRALDRRAPRDLETIVLKAIEKDPRHRYQTAGEMVEDLRRFLAGEPILARRASVFRRAALWASRRPAEAALAVVGVVAAVAIVGIAVSLRYNHLLNDSLYIQKIATAGLAMRDGNYGRLEYLLDSCTAEYRGLWEWRFLKNQCHPERLMLGGHGAGVYRLAYGLNGDRLYTASLDGKVRVWETNQGRLIDTLVGHTHDVYGLAVSLNGTLCVSTSADGIINFWDLKTGRATRLAGTVTPPVPVWDVQFSHDGRRFATAESGGVVRLWDVETLRGEAIASGTRGDVYRVAFSPDGRFLAYSGVDQPVTLWDLRDGSIERCLGEPGTREEAILGLAFSPGDGRYLAVAGTNGLVKLWEIANDRLTDLRGHVGDVYGVAFSPDGGRLATASGDPGVRIWDVAGGRELLNLSGHAATLFDVAFSPDGSQLATASQDRTARLWDSRRDTSAMILRGHDGPVNAVAYHPTGEFLATAGEDTTVRLWETKGWRPFPLPGHHAPVTSLAFSPVGEVLASADREGSVWLWGLSSPGREGRPLAHPEGEVTGLSFYPDGKHLATACADGAVRVWDVASGALRDTYKGHERSVRALAIGGGGRLLATGGEDRTVMVRDAESGVEVHPLKGHSCWVYCVAFAPDGETLSSAGGPAPAAPLAARLASVSGDGEVRVWDVTTGQNLLAIPAHGNFVRSVAFHPDGTRIATAGMDRVIKVWNASTGEEVLTLRGHAAGVLGLAFSPDGDLLASAGADGAVRVWNARR